jgi:pimeloyl-ACP methyl ester carboxylesterase
MAQGKLMFRFVLPGLALIVCTPAMASAAPAPQRQHATVPALQRSELRVKTSPGIAIRVVRLGHPGSLPPLVLLPGWTIGLEAWDLVASRLARDREVFLIDARSQGSSSLSLTENAPEDRADDLAEVLRVLKIHQPLVIAWSQGVQDLAAYVIKHGDAGLAGSILVDAVPSAGVSDLRNQPEFAEQIFAHMEIYRKYPVDFAEGMMQAIISNPGAAATRSRLAAISLRTPTSVGVAMQVADLFGADRSGVIFKRPAMLIVAENNPLRGSMSRWAADHGLAERPIAHAAHAVFIDQPEAFVGAVDRFDSSLANDAK